jgi:tetratricopeptide (TPR) repeat protein
MGQLTQPQDVFSTGPGPLTLRESTLLRQLKEHGYAVSGLLVVWNAQGEASIRGIDTVAIEKEGPGLLDVGQLSAAATEQYRQGNLGVAAAMQSLLLRMLVRMVGAEVREVQILAGNLAQTLRLLGEFVEARALQERAHARLLRLCGARHPDTLTAANNLAVTLLDMGDLDNARMRQEQIVRDLAEVNGRDQQMTLVAKGNLAMTMQRQGELAPAAELQEHVYERLKTTLGAEHPETLTACFNLAGTLLALGRMERARLLHTLAFDSRMRVLSQDHPDTVMALGGVAACLAREGELSAARKALEQGYAACERILDPGHPMTLTFGNNLVDTMRLLGDFVPARRLAQELHARASQALGSEHPLSLIIEGNLALTLLSLGDPVGARAIQERVYALHCALPAGHPDRLTSAGNLASTLVSLGDVVGAQKVGRDVYAGRSALLGSDHPAALHSRHNLADELWRLGDFEGARAIQSELYVLRGRVQGEQHPDTLMAGNSLGMTLQALGEVAAAKNILQTVHGALRDVLGGQHPNTLTAANNLALLLCELRDFAGAGSLYCHLLQDLCESGAASETAFLVAANVPMLDTPDVPWPQEVVEQTNALLPRLSRLLRQRLEFLPQESWAIPYGRFTQMHQRWLLWCMTHAPGSILLALSGLHGIQSWSQVRATRADMASVAHRNDGVKSTVASEYLEAQQALNALRERVVDRMHHDPNGTDLPELRKEERAVTLRQELAESRLAEFAPELAAGVGALPLPTLHDLIAELLPGEALLVLLQMRSLFALMLRPGGQSALVELGDRGMMDVAHAEFAHSMRGASDRVLRGGQRVAPDAFVEEVDAPAVHEGGLSISFWEPLLQHLQDVDRLHLVTGPDLHDALFEVALPQSHAHMRVQRYCGLPAYRRSALPDMRARLCALSDNPLTCVSDESWQGAVPIPFTSLDGLIPELHGVLHRVSGEHVVQQMATPEPARSSLRLVLSTHGATAGDGGGRGGYILLPGGLRLDPPSLAAAGTSIELMVALSCWGGRVGDDGHGNTYGSMSALQLAGLRCGIGCLAPVYDFYTPLLSGFLWHEVLGQQTPDLSAALRAAMARLRQGTWSELGPRLDQLRQGYRRLMTEIVERTRYRPGDVNRNQEAAKLLLGLLGWSLPGRWRRRLGSDQDFEVLRDELPGSEAHIEAHRRIERSLFDGEAASTRFVDACLDVLFREPTERDPGDVDEDVPVMSAIEGLCAVTVCFGGGFARDRREVPRERS